MSNEQLENLLLKAHNDKEIKIQVLKCGSDNICVSEVGQKYGHKFSPANVGRFQRNNKGDTLI